MSEVLVGPHGESYHRLLACATKTSAALDTVPKREAEADGRTPCGRCYHE